METTAIKPKSLKLKSFELEQIFNMIFDNPDIEKYLRERSDKKTRLKINAAKHARKSLKEQAKRDFLRSVGFEEAQVSLWRLK